MPDYEAKLTVRQIAALRDDFAIAIEQGINEGKQPRTIANRCLHLVVLHGVLPEQPSNGRSTPDAA